MKLDMKLKARETNSAYLFFQGMGTIGQIFPPVRQPKPDNWASAWQGVGDAFAATGDNLRDATDEFRNSQGIEGKSAHDA
ncbi:MAG: hypothetical protein LBK61_14245 [Spirochaetaceae bacterium]|jgi:hypothetical protein|nr:hypothetical protein [Spirochaetaceae bacterium]